MHQNWGILTTEKKFIAVGWKKGTTDQDQLTVVHHKSKKKKKLVLYQTNKKKIELIKEKLAARSGILPIHNNIRYLENQILYKNWL